MSTHENYAEHLAEQLGTDPEQILHLFRQQVDRVHDVAVRIARIKGDLARLASAQGARGQSSHWDHSRKALLATLAEARRAELLAASEKVVEGALDTYAHAHHDYRAFLDRGRLELEEFEHAHADLSEAFADLEREKGVMAYLEARLNILKATTYAYGAESRLTPA